MRSNSSKPDLSRSRVLSDDEALALMAADPDATPSLTTDPPQQCFRSPFVRGLRRKLKLSQQAFGETYGIPVSVIRDWEIHRSKPSATAMQYLKVIQADPAGTAKTCAAIAGAKLPQAAQ